MLNIRKYKGYSFDDVLIAPKYSTVRSRSGVDLSTTLGHVLMDIPFIAANMDSVCSPMMAGTMDQLGGFGVMHRNMPVKTKSDPLETSRFGCVAGRTIRSAVAFGVNDDLDDVISEANCWRTQILVLDIAHGHSKHALDALKYVKSGIDHEVTMVGGNVATRQGVADLVDAGADVVKVGIGPGSACSTRIVTGVGVPQLSAIADCAYEADMLGAQTIADGGIKSSGDAAKALGAGANAVMLGNLLAGAHESPGQVVDGYKEHRGMASSEAGSDYPEGVAGRVAYAGKTKDIISNLCKGVASACSYVGAFDLVDFHLNTEFIEISSSTLRESAPHDIVNV